MRDLPPALRGAVLMMLAAVFWTVMLVLVRTMSGKFSTFELMFFRNLVAVAVLTPLIMRSRGGLRGMRTGRLPMHCLRTLFAYLGMLGLFYGVARIALADAVALSFTQPLFIVVLAALVLREAVGAGRWAATAAGFAGVLIIVRPGFAEIGIATLVVLVSAALYAGSNICIKLLMRTDTPTQAVFYVNVLMIPLAVAPALLNWTAPGWADAPGLIGIGVSGTLGVYFVSGAYKAAEASAVVPYDFLRLPFTAAAAWVLFAEIADPWTWAGAAVIFAGTYSLARTESRKAAPAGQDPSPST